MLTNLEFSKQEQSIVIKPSIPFTKIVIVIIIDWPPQTENKKIKQLCNKPQYRSRIPVL